MVVVIPGDWGTLFPANELYSHSYKVAVTLVVIEFNLSTALGRIDNFIWKFKLIACMHVHVPGQILFKDIFSI